VQYPLRQLQAILQVLPQHSPTQVHRRLPAISRLPLPRNLRLRMPLALRHNLQPQHLTRSNTNHGTPLPTELVLLVSSSGLID